MLIKTSLLKKIAFDYTGRLVRQLVKDTTATGNLNNHLYSFEYGYDLNNNITKLSGIFPLFSFTNKYTYGKDNLLTKYEIESGKNVTYTYDGLNRLTKTSLSTATPIDITYSYYNSNRGDGYTTTKLQSETIDGVTYTYEYDTLGNITDIYRGDTHLYYYEYDAMNQLTHVRDYENAKSYSYTYDTAGNIIFEYISDVDSKGSAYNTVHKSYQYNDTNWGDKLMSYDGQTITYDAIGNPLSYRDGMTMTWKNGRQLATLQDSDDTISYEYDSSSIRTSKTIDGVKHTYAYLNGKLMYETRGESKFYYSYDSNGILYSVKYTLTDDSSMQTYFFTHNSRGDIVGIYSDTGVLSAKYEYDAWGNILSVTDSQGNAITDQNHIANLNPFRYRGYYYDSETGIYYLMSRYYDPVTHRFINADGYFQSGGDILDANMSAYCRNNPIMYCDPSGDSPKTLRELQEDIVLSTDKLNYSMKDITKALKDGYSMNDRFSVSENGGLYYDYHAGYQILDSIGAIIWSIEADADVGFGIGGSLGINDIVEFNAEAKWAPLALHFDETQGLLFGSKADANIGPKILGWDKLYVGSIGGTEFYDYLSGTNYENIGESHVIGLSFGAYIGVGASLSFGWNIDYISNRFCEIWG